MDIITVSTNPPKHPVVIGRIGGVYGIQGWVKVISFTEKVDNIFRYSPWLILFKSQWILINLESWRLIKKKYIAKIVGVTNRNIAMSLTNSKLVIDDSQLPSLYNNEYYWKDIIGCTVITVVQGNNLGYVVRIIETIAYDVLVVRDLNKRFVKMKDYLIPFVQDKIIKSINLIDKVILVNWDNNF